MLKFPHSIMKKIKFIFSTWRYQKMQLSKGSLNFLKIHIFIIFRVHKSILSQQISWYTPSDLKTPQELCEQPPNHLFSQCGRLIWMVPPTARSTLRRCGGLRWGRSTRRGAGSSPTRTPLWSDCVSTEELVPFLFEEGRGFSVAY